MIAGLATMCPERRDDVVSLGLKRVGWVGRSDTQWWVSVRSVLVGEADPGYRFAHRSYPCFVTTGLDPVVHTEVRLSMDCPDQVRQ